MSVTTIFSLFLLVLSPLATSSPTPTITTTTTTTNTTDGDDNPHTVYEALGGYNFPIGLLPKGALGYELDKATGKFYAYLNGSCTFSLEAYDLKYKSTISGYISQNKLTNLSGVSVKILFFWVNIVEVVRNGDELEFSVGIASASFPIENFYECPQCGCGLDCNNAGGKLIKLVRKIRSNPYLSSV